MEIKDFFRFVKVVAFVPVSHAEKVRQAMAKAGCGKLGEYDFCSFSSTGFGRFRGSEKSNPFIGKRGKEQKVKEEKIEMICPAGKWKKAVREIKNAHPYEEPAIEIYPLIYPPARRR